MPFSIGAAAPPAQSRPTMDAARDEALRMFRESGALLEGHFLLRSGRHSKHFFQCAQVCQCMDKVERLAEMLIGRLPDAPFDTVVAPAMGGLVIGQEVARQARKRFIFMEKEANGLALRRGFKIARGEPVLVVEDVITRGGRVREAIEETRRHGGRPVAAAVLVDRSEGEAAFDIPCASLVELTFPTYAPNDLPPELQASEPVKPGS